MLHCLDVPEDTRRIQMGGNMNIYMGGDPVERNFECKQHITFVRCNILTSTRIGVGVVDSLMLRPCIEVN